MSFFEWYQKDLTLVRRKRSWGTSTRRGFTIIEVLIAVLILGIGLTAIAMSIITSLRVTHKSRIRSEALAYARLEIERVQTNQFDSSLLLPGTNYTITGLNYDGYYSVVEDTNDFTKAIYLRIYYDDINDPEASPVDRPKVEIQSVLSKALHP